MTGCEHQAQEVVADVIVQCGLQLALGTYLAGFELVTELRVLALEQLAAAQGVDGSVLRGGHEPGARVVRDARLGPPLERGDERVLREILGQPDVAGDPREPGDELGGLDPPDGVDGAVGIGSRHGSTTSWRVGRTSTVPRGALGKRAATWIASLMSRASIR